MLCRLLCRTWLPMASPALDSSQVHYSRRKWRRVSHLFTSVFCTCLSVCRCCSCCCRFHWLCWMSSSMGGVARGGIGGGTIICTGGGGTSTTSLAPGLYISTKTASGKFKESEKLKPGGLVKLSYWG